MEDRETARMRKCGESKTTRIMMATVPHVISGLGLRKFQADGFLFTRVYNTLRKWKWTLAVGHRRSNKRDSRYCICKVSLLSGRWAQRWIFRRRHSLNSTQLVLRGTIKGTPVEQEERVRKCECGVKNCASIKFGLYNSKYSWLIRWFVYSLFTSK